MSGRFPADTVKIAILVGDGMGDYSCPELGGKTPLQVARIPNMRRVAATGEVRMVQTVPVAGLAPGSDVANMSLLGYNAEENYTGRAPIEAAGANIPLRDDDVAYRCNLVTIQAGRMADYSAGHITSEEARPLITAVQDELGGNGLIFHAGVQYRHLLVWSRGPLAVECQPPHDIADQPVANYLPRGERAIEISALMERSQTILRDHPVNHARIAAGNLPATQIWLWGQGRALKLKSYQELYGLHGGVISAVDLVRGLGRLAGLHPILVPGATGLIDTNYSGKVQAALDVLAKDDFVFLHVEAPDECGHGGDARKKTQAIELFDERIVGPVWRELEHRNQPYRLILCMDHRTPCATRGHTRDPVPMVKLDGPVGPVNREAPFDETIHGGMAQCRGHEWIRELLVKTKHSRA